MLDYFGLFGSFVYFFFCSGSGWFLVLCEWIMVCLVCFKESFLFNGVGGVGWFYLVLFFLF